MKKCSSNTIKGLFHNKTYLNIEHTITLEKLFLEVCIRNVFWKQQIKNKFTYNNSTVYVDFLKRCSRHGYYK